MKEAITSAARAEILIQALPYIKKYLNKTVVIKYGGNAMINDELKLAVIQDLVFLTFAGLRVVLVHGGGPEIDLMLKKTGIESRFVNGLRFTCEDTMEIVQMVLCGKVNKDICSLIEQAGGKAMGLCGLDGAMLKAKILGKDYGLVGEIVDVDVSIINSNLDTGIIPVISSVAYGIDEALGSSLNINADTAAAKIAAALSAEKLILITDVRGVMRNTEDANSLIPKANLNEIESLKKLGIVSKGMIPKVDCCKIAIEGGVGKAHIIDGRIPHALLIELFTDEGIGTMFES